MKLSYTRAMVRAALQGELGQVGTLVDPVFGLNIPVQVSGVPSEVLNPRETWVDGSQYDAAAEKLAAMFKENFKQFEAQVTDGVREAGPR